MGLWYVPAHRPLAATFGSPGSSLIKSKCGQGYVHKERDRLRLSERNRWQIPILRLLIIEPHIGKQERQDSVDRNRWP